MTEIVAPSFWTIYFLCGFAFVALSLCVSTKPAPNGSWTAAVAAVGIAATFWWLFIVVGILKFMKDKKS